MSDERDEEARLSSVTLENARSIFLARHRAEEELVRAKEALAKQSEWLRVTLASIGDAVVTTDPQGRVSSLNAVAETLTGWSEQEARGRSLDEVFRIVDERRTPVENPAARALREGRVVALKNHTLLLGKDGRETPIEDSAGPIRDEQGNVHGVVLIFRSIAERKRADEAQARLAAIVESSQDAIVSKTLDSRVVSWNAGAEQLFGYRAAEMIGRPITLLIPPERQDEETMILDQIRRGDRVESYETVRLTKAGRRIDVSLTISPILDGSGAVIGASKIARDVSARKRSDQRLAAQAVVTGALAESAGLDEAAPTLLRALCELFGWQVGALWYVDAPRKALRLAELHVSETRARPRFAAATREQAFERGVGLPGRVWQSGTPAWIPDLARDEGYVRAAAAAADGLRSAVAFPVVLGDVRGVIEFYADETRERDSELLQALAGIGSQIGQFIERTRAEAALRESEQRFRLMADNVPSIIWTAAPDGTITFVNESWFAYSGLPRAGNGPAGFSPLVVHPDDRERRGADWAKALEHGSPYESEVRIRRADGVYRWFVTRAAPRRDAAGAVLQWFGTSTDIDDRKQAESKMRFLADASATLAVLTDPESTLRKVAALAVPDFADWCAVDVQDADGTLRRVAVEHADPAKVEFAREMERRYPPQTEDSGVRRVIETGEPEWAASVPDDVLVKSARDAEHLKVIRSLGVRSYVCAPLKSRSRVLGAITFVTAESTRTYDADSVRAAEDLAHRAAIALENANLLAALKDADRRKDEFLAMLAHELRNPLAPIRNAVHIFRAKGPLTSELRWATEVIDRQVHQLTRLVEDLLDVSRITTGKVELRRETVELAAVFNSAVEASRPLIEKWGHQLTVSLPPEPLRIEVDPARLAQVISNLLNNAAKYTDHGGHVELRAEREATQVAIRVKDDGIGIPKESLPHIFGLFTQVDRSVERSEGGLGIGLTLVQRLVALHGGSVTAASDGPGRGSEFVVRLPVAGAPAALSAGQERSAEHQRPPAPVRVLVVDDNRDSADSLGMVLGILGHEVQTAHDGLEAVGAAAEFRPDVVLLDIGLPKLDGFEVARRIRSQEGGDDVLLVALTGWGQQEDRRRSTEAGFDEHMTKPVEFKTLEKLLAGGRAALAERRRRQPPQS